MWNMFGQFFSAFLFLRETEKVTIEHSALKVFLVLKGIFRHLTDSELRNVRLVDRQWYFAATSELVSRGFHLPTIKLYSCSSSRFRYRSFYGYYLDFENGRRSLWTDLYGADCPMIEFRHLHFWYPEKTQKFLRILRSPWLCSVTSLTLSMYRETCQELVVDWFLPSMPNLQNLSCFIRPEANIESTFHDLLSLALVHDANEIPSSFMPIKSLQLGAEDWDRQMGSKLRSFSVRFEEACSFPWTLLGFFPQLEDLKLEFGDAAALIACAANLNGTETTFCAVEALHIKLTHEPNSKEQVEDAERKAEALASASAELCNQFLVRQSLNVVSMIPAASFLDFLAELAPSGLKQIKFEIAAPVYMSDEDEHMAQFFSHLIPEILLKFPEMSSLSLQYLQYYSKTPFPIRSLQNRPIDLADYALQRNLKQLHFSTISAEIEPVGWDGTCLTVPWLSTVICQGGILFVNFFMVRGAGFQDLVELDVQASRWNDVVEVITASTKFKCIKKLVFRGFAHLKLRMTSMCFFPEVDRLYFPKDWFFRQQSSRQYEGLPGMKSLEVLRIEHFGILYHPTVASEVRTKMPRLKLIHLDEEFNNAIPADSYESLFEKLVPSGKLTSTWPSSMEHVQILPKPGVKQFFRFSPENLPCYSIP